MIRAACMYTEKRILQNPMTSYLNCIDSGVALAHLETAAKELKMNPK